MADRIVSEDRMRAYIDRASVRIVAMEICELAGLAEEQLARAVTGDPESPNAALTAQHLVAKLGCISDYLVQCCGDPGHRGGVAEWLLPPAYHDVQLPPR